MLESLDHADNSFVTLTYEKDRTSLEPAHLRDWLKRLRKRIGQFPDQQGNPRRVRFYAVGEYGDLSGRPHYHSALFGWPACSGGRRSGVGVCQCLACSVVRETWGFGHILCARLELKSAQYIAGYVIKKMTRRDDMRLHGRHPEFARMSLVPGIGATAMHDVASVLMQYPQRLRGDVPNTLAWMKGKELPLGRYLTRKLRKYSGLHEKAPEAALQRQANQMQIVRAFAWANDRSVSSVFSELNEPYAALLEGRAALKRSMQGEAL